MSPLLRIAGERNKSQEQNTQEQTTRSLIKDMNELGWITTQLKQVYDGDAWHGPSLRAILNGVTAEQAAQRPIAHTLWELVLHITVWDDVIRRRIAGETVSFTLSPEEDFPPVRDTSEAAWQRVLERLEQANSQLRAAMQSFSEKRLNDKVPGKPYDFRTMLYGVAQHQTYHAGQIALLKRAVSARA
jgi:uncharacterized damage-inducible protein DinB